MAHRQHLVVAEVLTLDLGQGADGGSPFGQGADAIWQHHGLLFATGLSWWDRLLVFLGHSHRMMNCR